MATRDRYHVLIVDSNAADARRTAAILQQSRVGRFVVSRAATIADAAARLACVRYDAVLMDLPLPDVDGLGAVKSVLALEPDAPLLVQSSVDDECLALEAVLSGAQDYLIKHQCDAQLRRAVRHAIERKRVERELRQLAKFDPLTGLPNRQLFHDRLELAVRRIDRVGLGVALIFIDLDGFKRVNDRHGHAVGDRLLKAVAGRLCRVVRRTDTVARLGGDEFTIILEGLRHADDAARVAEHALVSLRQPFELGGVVVELGASLGVAIASHPSEIPDALTHRADVAMYQAKARGGTGVQFDAAA
jgi:diguanylate cyclase (GGDEF)-like protein